MYHCHQEADIHVNMGMYGALVVYSNADKGDPSSAYNMAARRQAMAARCGAGSTTRITSCC